MCFDGRLITTAKSSLALVVETVGLTYAMYKLEPDIKSVPSVFKRKQLLQDLRSQVTAKGVALGSSIEAFAARLLTGPATTRSAS